MNNTGRIRLLCLCAALLAVAASAHAVTVYDLGADAAPILPDVIDSANSPVYLTNKPQGDGQTAAPATGRIETLRVGQYSQLHIGYDNAAAAVDDIAVNVQGDMHVDGKAYLGKDATNNQEGFPNAGAAKAIDLNVDRALYVRNGGRMILNGFSDDTGEGVKHTTVTADSVILDGGTLVLDDHSVLRTGSGLAEEAAGAYSVKIRNGGSLLLNSGIPALIKVEESGGTGGKNRDYYNSDESEWTPKGVDIAGGGAGILVDAGGVLAAGSSGGVVEGTAEQRLRVAKGGMLDAGRGNILVNGVGGVVIAGGYRAGYDGGGGKTTSLVAESGAVTFATGSSLAMSRALQRHLNAGGASALENAVLVQGRDGVVFENVMPSSLRTGMGLYGLALRTDAESGHTYLGVTSVDGAVVGSRTDGDRETFRQNMQSLWNPGRMNRDQSDNMYNLTAVETPTIEAYGESGLLNKAVLEALVDGGGQAVGGYGGVADRGIFEMYNGGAQWGANTAAYSAAGEFMAGLDRRVDRIGAEMDRLGEGWGGGAVHASAAGYGAVCATDPDSFERRFWIGGFGRNEEADLDYGISGYRYRPRGFMAGYDKIVGSFGLGAAVAYGRGKYEDKAAQANDSTITSYSAGVYGAYHASNGLNATAHAAFSHLDNDLADTRGGMRRRADYSGYAWSVGARVGYDKPLSDRMTLSPSVGVSRIQAVGRAHDESLDGVGVLRVGEVRRDSTLVPLDVTLGYDLVRNPVSVLRVTGNLGYAYDFEDDGLDGSFTYDGLAGATSMSVAGREAGRHRFNVGAGLVFTGSRVDLGARYDYFKRSEQTTHQAQGNIGIKF